MNGQIRKGKQPIQQVGDKNDAGIMPGITPQAEMCLQKGEESYVLTWDGLVELAIADGFIKLEENKENE